jgi:hypothetical protein
MASMIQKRPVQAPRTPARATSAQPGSAEKLEIMARRVRRGESVFHPQDATIDRPALVWLREPSDFRAALLQRL